LAVMSWRNVYVHGPRGRVTQQIGPEHLALDDNATDDSRRPGKLAHTCHLCL
jgi:hypothetical protein